MRSSRKRCAERRVFRLLHGAGTLRLASMSMSHSISRSISRAFLVTTAAVLAASGCFHSASNGKDASAGNDAPGSATGDGSGADADMHRRGGRAVRFRHAVHGPDDRSDPGGQRRRRRAAEQCLRGDQPQGAAGGAAEQQQPDLCDRSHDRAERAEDHLRLGLDPGQPARRWHAWPPPTRTE